MTNQLIISDYSFSLIECVFILNLQYTEKEEEEN